MVFQPHLLVCIRATTQQVLTFRYIPLQYKPTNTSTRTIYPDGVKLNRVYKSMGIDMTSDASSPHFSRTFQKVDAFLFIMSHN